MRSMEYNYNSNMNNQNSDNNEYSFDNYSILKIQEEDRQRIAMELHDTSLQRLAHVIHQVELASLYMDDDIIKSRLELADIKQNIKIVIEEIRNTIFDLRPMSFDDLGIDETIQRYIEYVNKNHLFQIHTEIGHIDSDSYVVLLNIYRIIQECISNAIHHSGGDEICLKYYSENHVCYIEIKDNGHGFVAGDKKDEIKHFGLSVIKERVMMMNGEIHIDSVLDRGTKITVKIPLISSEGKVENQRFSTTD